MLRLHYSKVSSCFPVSSSRKPSCRKHSSVTSVLSRRVMSGSRSRLRVSRSNYIGLRCAAKLAPQAESDLIRWADIDLRMEKRSVMTS